MLRDLDLDQLSIARDQPRENEEKELAEEEAKAEKELCYRAGCIKWLSTKTMPQSSLMISYALKCFAMA